MPEFIKENVLLAPFCGFKCGGACRYYLDAGSCGVDVLEKALEFAAKKSLPVKILGGGYNTLVVDNPSDFLLIHFKPCINVPQFLLALKDNITLDDNLNYLLLDETDVEGRKIFLAVKLTEDLSESTKSYSFLEKTLKDGEEYVDVVKDKELIKYLATAFTNNYLENVENGVFNEQ